MRVLVTGGLGYIGSHTTVKLIEAGYDVMIMDNLTNSKIEVLDGIEEITGTRPNFYRGDVTDLTSVMTLFINWDIDYVIHFAASKSVSASIHSPIQYYYNNINGLTTLLFAMHANGVNDLIFSSSCTVYGEPDEYPVNELTPTKKPTTPYGVSKYMCEQILEDSHQVNSVALRYFNPIGNHESGLIYENPNGTPENLMPYIIRVLKGDADYLSVFGDNYDTPDGTAIRDYINVNDLADAHVKSLNIVANQSHEIINIGTGTGSSVMKIIDAFKNEGHNIKYKILPRRDGDIEKIWSDTTKCEAVLKWKPSCSITDSVKSIIKIL